MRYVDGLAVDQVMARTDSSGNVAWYLTDQVGSVVEHRVRRAGLDKIVYDPYGNVVTQTNAANADRFGFAGMEYDSVTGLYYDHARYYNSVVGRFVSQDPKAFAAGDTNLYRYVGNMPTIGTDPTGYLSWEVQGGSYRRGWYICNGHCPRDGYRCMPFSITALVGAGVIGGVWGGTIGSFSGTLGGDDPRKQYFYGGGSVFVAFLGTMGILVRLRN